MFFKLMMYFFDSAILCMSTTTLWVYYWIEMNVANRWRHIFVYQVKNCLDLELIRVCALFILIFDGKGFGMGHVFPDLGFVLMVVPAIKHLSIDFTQVRVKTTESWHYCDQKIIISAMPVHSALSTLQLDRTT